MSCEMSNEQQEAIPANKKYENLGFVGSVKKLYLEAKSSDVKFLFGSTESTSAGPIASVVAHKSLLAAASPVFDAMFYSDLKEPGDVHVPDSSEAAFMEFLQFFYLAEIELTEENIADVMYLGHKYSVAESINVCSRFLKDIHNAENILIILDLAITYDQQELVKFCEKRILTNTAAVLKSASFLECDKEVLGRILKMDLLSCSEVELFDACMSWVKAKSGQEALNKELVETHLGELYYQIRFASMTVEELCEVGTKYKAVLGNVFMIVSSAYQSKGFNSSPRQIKWNADAAIECSLRNGIDRPYHLTRYKSITFSTSEPLLLGGFTCGKIVRNKIKNGKCLELNSDMLVEVDVIEATDLNKTNCEAILKMNAHLRSADAKVKLSLPVLIRPGFFYKISLGPFPDNHGYHSEVLKTELPIQSNITIELHNCEVAISPVNGPNHGKVIGLIWSLDFNNI